MPVLVRKALFEEQSGIKRQGLSPELKRESYSNGLSAFPNTPADPEGAKLVLVGHPTAPADPEGAKPESGCCLQASKPGGSKPGGAETKLNIALVVSCIFWTSVHKPAAAPYSP